MVVAGADQDFVEGGAIDHETFSVGAYRGHAVRQVPDANVGWRAAHCCGPGIGEELAHLGPRREGIGGVFTAAGAPSVEIIVGSGDDGAVDVEAPLRRLLRTVDGARTGGVGVKDGDIEWNVGALNELLDGPQATRSTSNDGNAADRASRSHCADPSMRAASSAGEMSKFSHTQESL